MISDEDFMWFVDRALDAMVGIVHELGEPLANERPNLPGANSPYAIVNHCLGVMGWWSEHAVAGGEVERDREAEFVAEGPINALMERVSTVRDAFSARVDRATFGEALLGDVAPKDARLPLGSSQGGALFHVYEELSQHLGQLEITRDLLLDRAKDRGVQ